jgi:cystathionine beta-lyase
MGWDFDARIDRRGTGSSKWSRYPADVLPMWVADMDFAVAPAILDAIAERLRHPVLGYSVARDDLRAQIVTHLQSQYGWRVAPDSLVFLPGVEPGFNMALKALLTPGQTLALQTPIYKPILDAPRHWQLQTVDIALDRPIADQAESLARADAVLLCNPHNPTGKVYSRDDLLALADSTGERPIISDEIHCDLVYSGQRHIPIAMLDAAIGRRCITLMSASKTYNIAGLKTAFAIVENPDLRARFSAARLGMVDSVNALGLEATLAAFRDAGAWKADMLAYLEANRDFLAREIARRFPAIAMQPPQASFLAWLDCSALDFEDPHAFFLERAQIGFSAGRDFGAAYGQFVRLNFGCPRAMLVDCLDRMEAALRSA